MNGARAEDGAAFLVGLAGGGGLAGPAAVVQARLSDEVASAGRVQGEQEAGVLGAGDRHPATERGQNLGAHAQRRRVNLGLVALPVGQHGADRGRPGLRVLREPGRRAVRLQVDCLLHVRVDTGVVEQRDHTVMPDRALLGDVPRVSRTARRPRRDDEHLRPHQSRSDQTWEALDKVEWEDL